MRVYSRKNDHGVEVYDAELNLVRTFAVPPRSTFKEPGSEGHAVPASRDRLFYATDTAVLKVDPEGREEWRFELGARGPKRGVSYTDVALSADDSRLWVYVPNVMADRGRDDEWIALDAATGEPLARYELPTAGHGGDHVALRDGRMLLEVGEGQDGVQIYLAGPGAAAPHDYGWGDRSLHGVSPDGTRFVTVGQDSDDLIVHAFPSGDALFKVTLPDFGFPEDEEDIFLEWSPGFLDDDTIIAVVFGVDEEEDTDWWRHFRLDARTGEVLGELEITTINQYDLDTLGDGTYVVTDTDGTLRRM